ncbi:MAG: hypothetical protein Q9200_002174 [Gallowayella weberi]
MHPPTPLRSEHWTTLPVPGIIVRRAPDALSDEKGLISHAVIGVIAIFIVLANLWQPSFFDCWIIDPLHTNGFDVSPRQIRPDTRHQKPPPNRRLRHLARRPQTPDLGIIAVDTSTYTTSNPRCPSLGAHLIRPTSMATLTTNPGKPAKSTAIPRRARTRLILSGSSTASASASAASRHGPQRDDAIILRRRARARLILPHSSTASAASRHGSGCDDAIISSLFGPRSFPS